jgi:hypothetical protein
VSRYRAEGSEELVNEGQWTFEIFNEKPYITFEGWCSPIPGSMEIEIMGRKIGEEPGNWFVRVERSVFGNPRLCIDRDLCYFYLKK